MRDHFEGTVEAYREYLEVEKPLNTKFIWKDGRCYRIANTTLFETKGEAGARLEVEAVECVTKEKK